MCNKKHHRLDGPAVITLNEVVGYFIDDKLLDTKEVETWIKDNNIDNVKLTNIYQILA